MQSKERKNIVSLVSYKHSMLTKAVACLLIFTFTITNVTYGMEGSDFKHLRNIRDAESGVREEAGARLKDVARAEKDDRRKAWILGIGTLPVLICASFLAYYYGSSVNPGIGLFITLGIIGITIIPFSKIFIKKIGWGNFTLFWGIVIFDTFTKLLVYLTIPQGDIIPILTGKLGLANVWHYAPDWCLHPIYYMSALLAYLFIICSLDILSKGKNYYLKTFATISCAGAHSNTANVLVNKFVINCIFCDIPFFGPMLANIADLAISVGRTVLVPFFAILLLLNIKIIVENFIQKWRTKRSDPEKPSHASDKPPLEVRDVHAETMEWLKGELEGMDLPADSAESAARNIVSVAAKMISDPNQGIEGWVEKEFLPNCLEYLRRHFYVFDDGETVKRLIDETVDRVIANKFDDVTQGVKDQITEKTAEGIIRGARGTLRSDLRRSPAPVQPYPRQKEVVLSIPGRAKEAAFAALDKIREIVEEIIDLERKGKLNIIDLLKLDKILRADKTEAVLDTVLEHETRIDPDWARRNPEIADKIGNYYAKLGEIVGFLKKSIEPVRVLSLHDRRGFIEKRNEIWDDRREKGLIPRRLDERRRLAEEGRIGELGKKMLGNEAVSYLQYLLRDVKRKAEKALTEEDLFRFIRLRQKISHVHPKAMKPLTENEKGRYRQSLDSVVDELDKRAAETMQVDRDEIVETRRLLDRVTECLAPEEARDANPQVLRLFAERLVAAVGDAENSAQPERAATLFFNLQKDFTLELAGIIYGPAHTAGDYTDTITKVEAAIIITRAHIHRDKFKVPLARALGDLAQWLCGSYADSIDSHDRWYITVHPYTFDVEIANSLSWRILQLFRECLEGVLPDLAAQRSTVGRRCYHLTFSGITRDEVAQRVFRWLLDNQDMPACSRMLAAHDREYKRTLYEIAEELAKPHRKARQELNSLLAEIREGEEAAIEEMMRRLEIREFVNPESQLVASYKEKLDETVFSIPGRAKREALEALSKIEIQVRAAITREKQGDVTVFDLLKLRRLLTAEPKYDATIDKTLREVLDGHPHNMAMIDYNSLLKETAELLKGCAAAVRRVPDREIRDFEEEFKGERDRIWGLIRARLDERTELASTGILGSLGRRMLGSEALAYLKKYHLPEEEREARDMIEEGSLPGFIEARENITDPPLKVKRALRKGKEEVDYERLSSPVLDDLDRRALANPEIANHPLIQEFKAAERNPEHCVFNVEVVEIVEKESRIEHLVVRYKGIKGIVPRSELPRSIPPYNITTYTEFPALLVKCDWEGVVPKPVFSIRKAEEYAPQELRDAAESGAVVEVYITRIAYKREEYSPGAACGFHAVWTSAEGKTVERFIPPNLIPKRMFKTGLETFKYQTVSVVPVYRTNYKTGEQELTFSIIAIDKQKEEAITITTTEDPQHRLGTPLAAFFGAEGRRAKPQEKKDPTRTDRRAEKAARKAKRRANKQREIVDELRRKWAGQAAERERKKEKGKDPETRGGAVPALLGPAAATGAAIAGLGVGWIGVFIALGLLSVSMFFRRDVFRNLNKKKYQDKHYAHAQQYKFPHSLAPSLPGGNIKNPAVTDRVTSNKPMANNLKLILSGIIAPITMMVRKYFVMSMNIFPISLRRKLYRISAFLYKYIIHSFKSQELRVESKLIAIFRTFHDSLDSIARGIKNLFPQLRLAVPGGPTLAAVMETDGPRDSAAPDAAAQTEADSYIEFLRKKDTMTTQFGRELQDFVYRLNPDMQDALKKADQWGFNYLTGRRKLYPFVCDLAVVAALEVIRAKFGERAEVTIRAGRFITQPQEKRHFWLIITDRATDDEYYLSFTDGQFKEYSEGDKTYITVVGSDSPEGLNPDYVHWYHENGWDFVSFKKVEDAAFLEEKAGVKEMADSSAHVTGILNNGAIWLQMDSILTSLAPALEELGGLVRHPTRRREQGLPLNRPSGRKEAQSEGDVPDEPKPEPEDGPSKPTAIDGAKIAAYDQIDRANTDSAWRLLSNRQIDLHKINSILKQLKDAGFKALLVKSEKDGQLVSCVDGQNHEKEFAGLCRFIRNANAHEVVKDRGIESIDHLLGNMAKHAIGSYGLVLVRKAEGEGGMTGIELYVMNSARGFPDTDNDGIPDVLTALRVNGDQSESLGWGLPYVKAASTLMEITTGGYLFDCKTSNFIKIGDTIPGTKIRAIIFEKRSPSAPREGAASPAMDELEHLALIARDGSTPVWLRRVISLALAGRYESARRLFEQAECRGFYGDDDNPNVAQVQAILMKGRASPAPSSHPSAKPGASGMASPRTVDEKIEAAKGKGAEAQDALKFLIRHITEFPWQDEASREREIDRICAGLSGSDIEGVARPDLAAQFRRRVSPNEQAIKHTAFVFKTISKEMDASIYALNYKILLFIFPSLLVSTLYQPIRWIRCIIARIIIFFWIISNRESILKELGPQLLREHWDTRLALAIANARYRKKRGTKDPPQVRDVHGKPETRGGAVSALLGPAVLSPLLGAIIALPVLYLMLCRQKDAIIEWCKTKGHWRLEKLARKHLLDLSRHPFLGYVAESFSYPGCAIKKLPSSEAGDGPGKAAPQGEKASRTTEVPIESVQMDVLIQERDGRTWINTGLINRILRQITSDIEEKERHKGNDIIFRSTVVHSGRYLADGHGWVPLDLLKDLDIILHIELRTYIEGLSSSMLYKQFFERFLEALNSFEGVEASYDKKRISENIMIRVANRNLPIDLLSTLKIGVDSDEPGRYNTDYALGEALERLKGVASLSIDDVNLLTNAQVIKNHTKNYLAAELYFGDIETWAYYRDRFLLIASDDITKLKELLIDIAKSGRLTFLMRQAERGRGFIASRLDEELLHPVGRGIFENTNMVQEKFVVYSVAGIDGLDLRWVRLKKVDNSQQGASDFGDPYYYDLTPDEIDYMLEDEGGDEVDFEYGFHLVGLGISIYRAIGFEPANWGVVAQVVASDLGFEQTDEYEEKVEQIAEQIEATAYLKKEKWLAVVLAAGEGKRLKADFEEPKLLIPIGGKPLIRHVLDIARRINLKTTVVVPKVTNEIGKAAQDYADAVISAEPGIFNAFTAPYTSGILKKFPKCRNMLFLPADIIPTDVNSLVSMMKAHTQPKRRRRIFSFVTSIASPPFSHGFDRVVRTKDGRFYAIITQREIDLIKRKKETLNLPDGMQLDGNDLDNLKEICHGIHIWNSRVYRLLICKLLRKIIPYDFCSTRDRRKDLDNNILNWRAIRWRSRFWRLLLKTGIGDIPTLAEENCLLNLNEPAQISKAREMLQSKSGAELFQPQAGKTPLSQEEPGSHLLLSHSFKEEVNERKTTRMIRQFWKRLRQKLNDSFLFLRMHLACAELASNIMHCGKGGKIEIYSLSEKGGSERIEVIGIDSGPGIDDPNKLLQKSIGVHRKHRYYAGDSSRRIPKRRVPKKGFGTRHIVAIPDGVVYESNGKKWIKEGLTDEELRLVHIGSSDVNEGTKVTLRWRVGKREKREGGPPGASGMVHPDRLQELIETTNREGVDSPAFKELVRLIVHTPTDYQDESRRMDIERICAELRPDLAAEFRRKVSPNEPSLESSAVYIGNTPELEYVGDVYPKPVEKGLLVLPDHDRRVFVTARFNREVVTPRGEMWVKEKGEDEWYAVKMSIHKDNRWGDAYRFGGVVPLQVEKITFRFYAEGCTEPLWAGDVDNWREENRGKNLKVMSSSEFAELRRRDEELVKGYIEKGKELFGITDGVEYEIIETENDLRRVARALARARLDNMQPLFRGVSSEDELYKTMLRGLEQRYAFSFDTDLKKIIVNFMWLRSLRAHKRALLLKLVVLHEVGERKLDINRQIRTVSFSEQIWERLFEICRNGDRNLIDWVYNWLGDMIIDGYISRNYHRGRRLIKEATSRDNLLRNNIFGRTGNRFDLMKLLYASYAICCGLEADRFVDLGDDTEIRKDAPAVAELLRASLEEDGLSVKKDDSDFVNLSEISSIFAKYVREDGTVEQWYQEIEEAIKTIDEGTDEKSAWAQNKEGAEDFDLDMAPTWPPERGEEEAGAEGVKAKNAKMEQRVNTYRINGVKCNLTEGFHVSPCTALAFEIGEIYEETGIKVEIGKAEHFVGFFMIDEILEAHRRGVKYDKLPIELKIIVKKLIVIPQNFNITTEDAILEGYGYRLMNQLPTLVIMPKGAEGSEYNIRVQGDHPEDILRDVAEYVRDFSREELLLEAEMLKKYPEEAESLAGAYYERLEEIVSRIDSGSEKTASAESAEEKAEEPNLAPLIRDRRYRLSVDITKIAPGSAEYKIIEKGWKALRGLYPEVGFDKGVKPTTNGKNGFIKITCTRNGGTDEDNGCRENKPEWIGHCSIKIVNPDALTRGRFLDLLIMAFLASNIPDVHYKDRNDSEIGIADFEFLFNAVNYYHRKLTGEGVPIKRTGQFPGTIQKKINSYRNLTLELILEGMPPVEKKSDEELIKESMEELRAV